MSKSKNDIIYFAADIERYHKGLMSPGDMHALEKAALEDPFLADALEGFGNTNSASADMSDLVDRLNQRTKEEQAKLIPLTRPRTSFSWWKVAAMVILIAGAGMLVYQFGFNKQNQEIAQATDRSKAAPPISDSDAARTPAPEQQGLQQQESKSESPEQKEISANKPAEKIKTKQAKEAPSAKPGAVSEKSAEPVSDAVVTYRFEEELAKNEEAVSHDTANITAVARRQQQMESKQRGIVRAQAPKSSTTPGIESRLKKAEVSPNIFRGRVTDAENNALPFSNITNTSDNVGTYADANGFFNLTSPDSVLNVKVSSIGFEPSIVQLQNDVPANIVKLEEDRKSLAEVVISNKQTNSRRAVNNNMVELDAEPADGWSNYDLYLVNNLKEPDELVEKKKEALHGAVELSFEVSPSGEPVNITIKKSLCPACDREAIRLLREGPKWKRKARKGKTSVTINF